jgi:Raf kinase inhibitor-like YbhB/YbcL family protein
VTRAARLSALAVTTGLTVALLAACDTGDGKQLQPYDPADYPQAAPTTVDPESDAAFDPPVTIPEPEPIDPLPGVEQFTLTGPWLAGTAIDPRYTCDGDDVSPALSWGAVPDGTVEIAIVMVDDSAVSNGQPFVHWVIAGLDPAEIALAEGDVPPGAVQALNFFGDVGYGGPCPPPGDPAHLYRLTAYALNTSLQRADATLATEFLEAIATATIGSVDLNGTYQR